MSSSFPVSIRFQVEGDADVQNKLRGLNQGVQQSGTTAATATGKVDKYGQAVAQTGKGAQTTAQQHVSLGSRMQASAGGFALAASSAVSLWSAYDNVTDAATKVELAQGKLLTADQKLSKAREALTKLQKSGTATAIDLEQANRQIEIAEVAQERAAFGLTNAQEDLNKTWVQSATSIIPSMFTMISGLGMAFKGLQGSTAAASAAGGMGRGGFGGVLRLLTSPLGIIVGIIGGVVAALWALRTNFMGVRDKARDFINWIRDMTNGIPFLRQAIDWLVEGYKWLENTLFGLLGKIPIVGDMFAGLSDAQTGASTATDMLGNGLETLKKVFADMPAKISKAANTLWDGLVNTASQLYKILTDPIFHQKIIDGIWYILEGINAFWNTNIRPIAESLWGAIVDTATTIYTTLTDPVFQKQVTDGIWYIIDSVAAWFTTNVVPIAQALWGKIVDTATTIYNLLKDPVFQQRIIDGIRYIFNTVGTWLSTNVLPIAQKLWGYLVNGAQALYDALVDPVWRQNAIDAVRATLVAVGGWLSTNVVPILKTMWGYLKSGAQALYDTLVDPVWQKNATDAVRATLVALGGWLSTNAVPLLTTAWGYLKDGAQALYDTLIDPVFQKNATDAVRATLVAIGGWISVNALPLLETAWGYLKDGAQALYDTLVDPVWQAKAGEALNALFTAIGGWILTNAQQLGSRMWGQLQKVADQFPAIFGAALGSLAGTLIPAIINGLANATTDLPERLTAFFRDTGKFFTAIYNGFIGLFTHPEGVQKAAAEFPGKVQEAITKVDFQGAFSKAFGEAFAKNGGNEAYQRLVGNVNSLMNWISKGINELPGRIGTLLSGAAGALGAAISNGIRSAIGQAAKALTDAIVGGTNSLLAHIKTGITQLPGHIGTALQNIDVKAIYNGLVTALKKVDVIGAIKSAWGGFTDWLTKWFEPKGGGGGAGPAEIAPGGLAASVIPTSAGMGGLNQGGIVDDGGFGTGAGTAPPDFAPHKIAWNNYKVYVEEKINEIGLLYQRLVQGLVLLQQAMGTALAGMVVQWSGHVVAVTAQINALGMNFQRIVQGLTLLQAGVGQALAGMVVQWAGHAAAVGAQVNATGMHYQRLVQGLMLLTQAVGQALGGMIVTWSGHAQAVGAQVNSTGQHLVKLVQGYRLLMLDQGRALGSMDRNWSAHATRSGQLVNAAGQHLRRLVQGYSLLVRAVQQGINQMNNSWRNHTSAISSAVNTASARVRALASAVSSNMRNIASSMNTATNAANRLRNSINALRSKNLTITTRYRTIGAPVRAAKGFSGVVSQPTRLFVGEGNKPEMVTVTPLTKSGGQVGMNKAAQTANHMFQQPTIRAGGSTGIPSSPFTGVIPELKKYKRIFEDTIADWVDNFGYELNKFDPITGGIRFEVAGGKHYDKISAQRAMNFSRARGYTLRAYLSRKAGSNLTMRMDKGDIPHGMPGGGGGGVGIPGGRLTGANLMKALKYVTNAPNLNKPLASMTMFEDGSGNLYYQDGTVAKIKHNYKGPFNSGNVGGGGGNTSDMIRAAAGFSGIVSSPTKFLAGEHGRESVNIAPLSQGMGGRRGGGGGGRPVIIQLNIKSELDGRVVSESIRKELLGGIYSMS